MNEDERMKSKEDLELLCQIKEYENKIFQERYNAINVRFKGKVDFDYFHEN